MSLVRINRIRPEILKTPFHADYCIAWRVLFDIYLAQNHLSMTLLHATKDGDAATVFHIGNLIFSPPMSEFTIAHTLGRCITSFYYTVRPMISYSSRTIKCT